MPCLSKFPYIGDKPTSSLENEWYLCDVSGLSCVMETDHKVKIVSLMVAIS